MNLKEETKDLKIPTHIGFIIDGNGRWAKKRGLPRTAGHKVGFDKLMKAVEYVNEVGIKYMSVYAFSTENWKRPEEEVSYLMKLFKNSFDVFEKKFKNKNVKIVVSGDRTKFDAELQEKMNKSIENTKNNTGLVLNMCVNYGGRDELALAFNRMIKDSVKDVTPEIISSYLYTSGMPDLDYIIRTSGEHRLSNFMPFQSTYAEFYFPKFLWPDFNRRAFVEALEEYSRRDRRFGNIK